MQAGKNPEPRKRLLKSKNSIPYKFIKGTALPTVNEKSSFSFFRVLRKRKSERKFQKTTFSQLSNVLWHSAKAKAISKVNSSQILYHSNCPSAGAIHPIDVLVSPPGTLPTRNLYLYDPFTHKLWQLDISKKKLLDFLKHIDSTINITNATILWLAGDISRTKEKYKNPESLVWRDAGALLMTIQLVATALNLHSCAIGTLAEPHFKKLFNNPGYHVSAGGILIG